MEEKSDILKCVMCGNPARYLDPDHKKPLCEKCTIINEGIKQAK